MSITPAATAEPASETSFVFCWLTGRAFVTRSDRRSFHWSRSPPPSAFHFPWGTAWISILAAGFSLMGRSLGLSVIVFSRLPFCACALLDRGRSLLSSEHLYDRAFSADCISAAQW